MKGIRGTEPEGVAADCFYVLAMHGADLTVPDLQRAIAAENAPAPAPTPAQVAGALARTLAKRRPPLVERASRARWRITGHGYAMLAAWCGEDDEPARVPCGLGWPG